ncbi:hypothetical protein ACU6ZM_24460 [Klebsiella aerogenes]
MTDSHMNLKVLNLGISTLLEFISLTDSEAPADDVLHLYQPHLRALARELEAFGATYRDTLPEEMYDAAERKRREDAQIAEREVLIHARVKRYPAVSLLDSDTPERTLRLLDCTCSLQWLITWLNTHVNRVMEPYLPELTDIACEATVILDECVMNIVSDERHRKPELVTGLEREESIKRLGRLCVALMTCINEISQSDDRQLHVWLPDLQVLVLEMLMAYWSGADDILSADSRR